jgi:hypothetical protein
MPLQALKDHGRLKAAERSQEYNNDKNRSMHIILLAIPNRYPCNV